MHLPNVGLFTRRMTLVTTYWVGHAMWWSKFPWPRSHYHCLLSLCLSPELKRTLCDAWSSSATRRIAYAPVPLFGYPAEESKIPSQTPIDGQPYGHIRLRRDLDQIVLISFYRFVSFQIVHESDIVMLRSRALVIIFGRMQASSMIQREWENLGKS